MREWPIATLQELADIRVSNVDKKSLHGETPVRLCNYMDAYGNDYIHAGIPFMEATATTAEILRFRVNKGDVLITKDSETPFDIGIPAVVVDDIDNLVCGYHLALLKPNRDLVDSVFLCKQLGTPAVASYFSRYAAGSTRYGLSNRAVANTQIPLPSLLQQRKVAAVLTSIDTSIEKTEALIEKYQQIKAGLMHDLFTRGVLPNGQLRPPRECAPELYQKTAIGWIPVTWTLKYLSEAADVIDPQPDHRTPPESNEGIAYVGIGDFDRYQELALASCRKIIPDAYEKQRRRFSVDEGDVIFGKIGTIGQAKRLPFGGYAVSANVILFKPKIDSYYFYSAVTGLAFDKQVANITNTTSQPALGIENVRCLRLPVPSDEEAVLIGTTIQSAARLVSSETRRLDKLWRQKNGLMQDLLTGKVRVKVATEALESVGG